MVKIESLAAHRDECEFNPKRPVECDKGCELFIPKDELPVRNIALNCVGVNVSLTIKCLSVTESQLHQRPSLKDGKGGKKVGTAV